MRTAGARYVEAPLEGLPGISPDERTDRRRRLGRRARTCGRWPPRPPAASSAARSCSSSPIGPVRRSTGRRSRGSIPRWCPGGDDATLAATLDAVRPDVVVLAGYMRIVGPAVLAAFGGRILNTHPSLLPAFPGAHAVADALAHGVDRDRLHRPPRRRDPRRRPDRRSGGGADPARRRRGDPARPDPGRRAPPPAARRRPAAGRRARDRARRPSRDRRRRPPPTRAIPPPRRALLSVSDKTGLADLGRGLVARGFELVSTGGTARALRDAGLPVTDVAAVTGFPEMLDGRVKTLHPRVHAGILADRRLADHRRQLLAAAIAPFELVVVNLYPFAAALERPGHHGRRADRGDRHRRAVDGPGGRQEPRQRRDRHVARRATPRSSRPSTATAGSTTGLRRALALEAFRHTAAYDARIAAELPGRMAAAGVGLPDEPGLPGAADPYPPTLTVALEKVETLRYGENPHQPAARYRRPGDAPSRTARSRRASRRSRARRSPTTTCSTRPRLRRSVAPSAGPACVIVKHTNPCGAAERATLARGVGGGARRRTRSAPSAASWR